MDVRPLLPECHDSEVYFRLVQDLLGGQNEKTHISIISRSASSVCNKLDTSVVFQRKREPEDEDTDYAAKKTRIEADEEAVSENTVSECDALSTSCETANSTATGASARDQQSERLVLYVAFVTDIKQYLLRERKAWEQTEVKLAWLIG